MSVRQAVSNLTSFLKASPVAWQSPKMQGISEELARNSARMRPPTPHLNYRDLHARFVRATQTNDWTGIDLLDWNDSTYILWEPAPCLLSMNRFQYHYRRYLETTKTARPYKRLIYAYMAAYDPRNEGIKWASTFLRRILMQKRHFILGYWRQIELDLHLFSPEQGLGPLADRCLRNPDSVFSVLHELGLKGPLGKKGLARHAYLAALQMVNRDQLQNPLLLKRFLEWSISDEKRPLLRFPDLRESIVETFLSSPPPSDGCRQLLLQFFSYYDEARNAGDFTCPDLTSDHLEIISLFKQI